MIKQNQNEWQYNHPIETNYIELSSITFLCSKFHLIYQTGAKIIFLPFSLLILQSFTIKNEKKNRILVKLNWILKAVANWPVWNARCEVFFNRSDMCALMGNHVVKKNSWVKVQRVHHTRSFSKNFKIIFDHHPYHLN